MDPVDVMVAVLPPKELPLLNWISPDEPPGDPPLPLAVAHRTPFTVVCKN
jgi:hypothetical protein